MRVLEIAVAEWADTRKARRREHQSRSRAVNNDSGVAAPFPPRLEPRRGSPRVTTVTVKEVKLLVLVRRADGGGGRSEGGDECTDQASLSGIITALVPPQQH